MLLPGLDLIGVELVFLDEVVEDIPLEPFFTGVVGDFDLFPVLAFCWTGLTVFVDCPFDFAGVTTSFFTGFAGLLPNGFFDDEDFTAVFCGFLSAFLLLVFLGEGLLEELFAGLLAAGLDLEVAFFFCCAVAIQIR